MVRRSRTTLTTRPPPAPDAPARQRATDRTRTRWRRWSRCHTSSFGARTGSTLSAPSASSSRAGASSAANSTSRLSRCHSSSRSRASCTTFASTRTSATLPPRALPRRPRMARTALCWPPRRSSCSLTREWALRACGKRESWLQNQRAINAQSRTRARAAHHAPRLRPPHRAETAHGPGPTSL